MPKVSITSRHERFVCSRTGLTASSISSGTLFTSSTRSLKPFDSRKSDKVSSYRYEGVPSFSIYLFILVTRISRSISNCSEYTPTIWPQAIKMFCKRKTISSHFPRNRMRFSHLPSNHVCASSCSCNEALSL